MKKIINIIILLVMVVMLTGCKGSVKEISYKSFKNNVSNRGTFVVEIKKDGCPYCTEYEPVFTKVMEDNGINAYTLNLSSLSTNENSDITINYEINATPTTLFFKDGQEIFSSRIEGSVSEDRLTKVLKRLDFIK